MVRHSIITALCILLAAAPQALRAVPAAPTNTALWRVTVTCDTNGVIIAPTNLIPANALATTGDVSTAASAAQQAAIAQSSTNLSAGLTSCSNNAASVAASASNGVVAVVAAGYLPLAGGTLSGTLGITGLGGAIILHNFGYEVWNEDESSGWEMGAYPEGPEYEAGPAYGPDGYGSLVIADMINGGYLIFPPMSTVKTNASTADIIAATNPVPGWITSATSSLATAASVVAATNPVPGWISAATGGCSQVSSVPAAGCTLFSGTNLDISGATYAYTATNAAAYTINVSPTAPRYHYSLRILNTNAPAYGSGVVLDGSWTPTGTNIVLLWPDTGTIWRCFGRGL